MLLDMGNCLRSLCRPLRNRQIQNRPGFNEINGLTCHQLRKHSKRAPGTSLNRQFIRMALLQVVTFSICSLPVSLHSLLEHFRLTDVNKHINVHQVFLCDR